MRSTRGPSRRLRTRAGAAVLLAAAAAGAQPVNPFTCPDSPNCVSSDARDSHAIAPLRIRGTPQLAWQALEQRLQRTERVKIVSSEPDYLRAEFTTRLLRFTDDVEFELRADQGIIAMRSASRVGYYDFGANRSRLEQLRKELRAEGVVE